MAERSRYEPSLPGYNATNVQPGSANVQRLRARAHAGYGQQHSEALREQRAYRRAMRDMERTTTEDARLPPRISSVEEITRGLGLTQDQEQKLQRCIRDTRADYGLHPQLRVPRVVHARTTLGNLLQHSGLDGDVRMEVQRRAMAYWRQNAQTDYEGKPMIRHVVTKSQAARPTLLKRFSPPEDEEEQTQGQSDEQSEQGDGEQFDPQGDASGGEDDGQQAPPEGQDTGRSVLPSDGAKGNGKYHPVNVPEVSRKDAKKLKGKNKPKLKAQIKEDGEGGHAVSFHPEVEAHLPHDADYQHHATEYAKHSAMFQIARGQDPHKADAHRHAANLHAKVANALHRAGQTDPNRFKGPPDQVEDPLFGGDLLGEDPSMTQDEQQMQDDPDGQGYQPPSPGNDVEGNPLPGAPDGERNPPGRDSEIERHKDLSERKAGFNAPKPPNVQGASAPNMKPQVGRTPPPKRSPFGKSARTKHVLRKSKLDRSPLWLSDL